MELNCKPGPILKLLLIQVSEMICLSNLQNVGVQDVFDGGDLGLGKMLLQANPFLKLPY